MLKFVGRALDRLETRTKPGTWLGRLWPVLEAQETFLRTPDTATMKGPHVRDFVSLKRLMGVVVVALLPCVLFGMYNAGYQRLHALGEWPDFWPCLWQGAIRVVPIIVVSYAAGAVVEFVFSLVRRHPINEGFLVTGLLYPLTLPPDIPLWMVAAGIAFGVLIGKEVFGGTGMNILNPALTARAFVFFAYPAQMSGDKVWVAVNWAKEQVVDGMTGASPLGLAYAARAGEDVTGMLAQHGYGLAENFFGLVPGSIGETSTLLCLVGAVILLVTGTASWRIMLSMLLAGAATAFAVGGLAGPDSSGLMALSPVYQLCMGGFAFGLVFMATDPVSATATNTGMWIYGALTGFLSIVIRTLNPAYPEGVMLAILFMNVFAPTIDHFVVRANVRRRLKRA